MNKIALSVVIPAYNEQSRIAQTLEHAIDYLEKNVAKGEIIVVDDGSKDDTARVVSEIARNKSSKSTKVILCRLTHNLGKGGAVKTGMLKAKYDWILMMDADECTPIKDVNRLLRHKLNAEVIYGSRYLDKSLLKVRQPITRRIVGRAGNLTARMVLGVKLVDTQCGFKLFSRRASQEIFKRTTVMRWGWDLEVLAIAMNRQITIAEVPVSWRHVEGSTFRASRGIGQTFKELFEIRKNLQKGKYQ